MVTPPLETPKTLGISMTDKKIAIVILNWNGQKMLEQFLPSVVEHSSDEAEIIVADNASTDDSITFLKNN